jgi:protein SCO1
MSPLRLSLRILSLVLAGVILFLAGLRVSRARQARAVVAAPDFGTVQPFSLTDQKGRRFSLGDLNGKVWVADFIFTRCKGPCPMVSKRMSELRNEFASKRDLRFVSFSVDPDFDTPMILKSYADAYTSNHDQWRFLTGPRREIVDLIGSSFRLAVGEPTEEKDGTISILHSLHLVLVDGEGRIAGIFDSTDPEAVERLRVELRRLE